MGFNRYYSGRQLLKPSIDECKNTTKISLFIHARSEDVSERRQSGLIGQLVLQCDFISNNYPLMLQALDFTPLRNAIASLHDGIAVVSDADWFYDQSREVQNTLIAGVIKNFEFVYELSIKMLKRQLELEAASAVEIDEAGFKDLLRIAAEKGFITHVEKWFYYRKMRNITSHTYDHAKAEQVYEDTLGFIDDAVSLLNHLESRHADAQA